MSATNRRIPKNYRPDIDGLRAIAIIPVVLFHAGLGVNGGFIGVDVFFVISGYLLSGIVIQEMQEKRFSFLTFYERRFRRLAPAFIVMFMACLIAFSALMLPKDYAELNASGFASLFFYANFYFYGSIDYFSQSADLMPLLHMWSLAIEEQFYAVLPISMMLTLMIFPARWLPVLIGITLMFSFVLCIYYTNAHRPFAFYLPHTRAWELLAGTFLASLHRLPSTPRQMNWVGGVALIVLLVALFSFDERSAFPGWIAAIPVFATATLIHSGFVSPDSFSSRLLANHVLVFIGKISYSLYLWHWPVIVFFKYADLAPENLAARIGMVAISFVLAVLSWAYIEQPVRHKKVFASTNKMYAAAVASAILLGVVALSIVRLDGLPNRLPTELNALLEEDKFGFTSQDCPLTNSPALSRPCPIGATDRQPSFIMIGDSHAFALTPPFHEAATAQDLAGLRYTLPGFFPGLGMSRVGSARIDTRTEKMLTVIAAHPEVRTLVFAAAWADYATGTNWKGSHWLFQDNVSAATNQAENAEIFSRSIKRLVAALPDHNIIFLDDVPAGIELDLSYFARRSILRTQSSSNSHLPLQDVMERRGFYVPLLEEVTDQNEHVQFVQIFRDFCTQPTGCPLFMQDSVTPFYSDGDHLSLAGALTFTDQIVNEVLPIVLGH